MLFTTTVNSITSFIVLHKLLKIERTVWEHVNKHKIIPLQLCFRLVLTPTEKKSRNN